MFHTQSAYLDQNRYRAGYPGQMHLDRNIPHREELYVNTYIRPAQWWFGNVQLWKCYWLGRVACRPEVASALESSVCVGRVEAHLFLCIPACLQILCSAILARKAAGRVVWQSIAGYLCIAAFTCLCPGNSTPRIFSSRTSVRGFWMKYLVSSIAAHKKPSVAILAIFNARCMSDCSSCTRPPCLAIVAEMLKPTRHWLLLLTMKFG